MKDLTCETDRIAVVQRVMIHGMRNQEDLKFAKLVCYPVWREELEKDVAILERAIARRKRFKKYLPFIRAQLSRLYGRLGRERRRLRRLIAFWEPIKI